MNSNTLTLTPDFGEVVAGIACMYYPEQEPISDSAILTEFMFDRQQVREIVPVAYYISTIGEPLSQKFASFAYGDSKILTDLGFLVPQDLNNLGDSKPEEKIRKLLKDDKDGLDPSALQFREMLENGSANLLRIAEPDHMDYMLNVKIMTLPFQGMRVPLYTRVSFVEP